MYIKNTCSDIICYDQTLLLAFIFTTSVKQQIKIFCTLNKIGLMITHSIGKYHGIRGYYKKSHR